MSSNNRTVERVLTGIPATDGAGVNMTRVIATPELDHFDPFLLLDEFRSDDPDDYIAGFPDHPHRGFETVTYMLAGFMKHRDNKGNQGVLGPGSVQWMTAGRGIVHSEMPEQEDGLMWGFQLWVNLPATDKMCEPRYQDIPASDVPTVEIEEGVTVKIIAGEVAGVEGPVKRVTTEPLYIDAHLDPGSQVSLPLASGHNAFVYVYDGSIAIVGNSTKMIDRGEIALLGDGRQLAVKSDAGARLILVAGRPLNEPVARYGPFVMNTEDEIRQAVEDLQQGLF